MNCPHKHISNMKVRKEVFDLVFEARTSVCDCCGAHLRDQVYETKYMNWLEGIYKKRRDKFQVQCQFSHNLLRCAENFLKDYPGISPTVLIRVLLTIYLNIIDQDRQKSLQFNSLLDQGVFDSFANDKKRKKVNIQLKPKMMIEVTEIAGFLERSPSALIEEVVVKQMTALTSQNKKLISFWEKEILVYLEMFLKAA